MRSRLLIFGVFILSVLIMNACLVNSVAAKSARKARDEAVIEAPMLDINTATAEEFQQIRGIGPKLAARIIQYRLDNGEFKTVNDIMKVKGVGSAKFEKIRDNLKV